MKNSRAAVRYARSLVDLAQEKNLLDKVNADMELVQNTIAESRDLELMLSSPVVKSDKKGEVLKAIFGGKVDDLSMSFIQLITKNGRERLLSGIAKAVVAQYQELKGIVVAEITSAIQLTEDIKTKIIAKIKAELNKEIIVDEKVDPSIIGGLIVRVGDRQYDASIANKLNQLRKEFNKTAV